MFNMIEKEMQWRKAQGLPEGYETVRRYKPTVAVGAEGPLGGSVLMADYYRMSLCTLVLTRHIHVYRWRRRLG